MAEYVELRRATSAAVGVVPAGGVRRGQPLPDAGLPPPAAAVGSPRTGNDLLSWYNDLASLERDRATSGGHNLVLAVARRVAGASPAEAVERVAERWREAMRRFVALRAAVPSFGPALDEAVTDHLDGVADAVRGTIEWTLESGRYPTGQPQPASSLRG